MQSSLGETITCEEATEKHQLFAIFVHQNSGLTLLLLPGVLDLNCIVQCLPQSGPAITDAGPSARPRRGAPLSSCFTTSSCSVNRNRAIRPWQGAHKKP